MGLEAEFPKAMYKEPLISVIMVTRNAVDGLERAIKSVLAQKYVNIELIIIDGGSSDGTIDIIRKYEERISRWFSEIDAGIYDAMNKGVKLARGGWIYFLGADDVLENCLHKVVPLLKNSRVIYYGDVYLPGKNKIYAGEFKWHTLVAKNINHQSIFYPRGVFSNYLYDLKYKVLADYNLNMRCWGDGRFKFKYLPILVAIHGEQGSSHRKLDEIFLKDKPELVYKYFGRKLAVRNRWMKVENGLRKLMRAMIIRK